VRFLKQSTSVDVPIGPFVDSTDGVTAETSLTITQPDIRLKKNGGAWAQKNAAQTLSHEENGYYEVTLDATDTNTLGLLRLAVNESGAMPIWEDFMVLSANVYDSLIGGGDTLDVQVTGMGANVITSSVINTDAITSTGLAASAANEIADAALDRADAVETGLTLRQALRLIAAAVAGKLSGGGTSTVTIRNAVADSKDRIVATTPDANGNRTAITVDLT
jgi:hypothetical protein